MTERLDRIEESVAQLNTTLNVIADEFIRPIAQQSAANFRAIGQIDSDLDRLNESLGRLEANHQAGMERLDRVNATLDRIAEQSQLNEQQISRNAEAISNNASAIAANERRFENLLNESRADRAESRQRFEAHQETMQALLLELTRTNRRVENLERAS
ncbi:MAG: hypothetical protein WBD47_13625 [Phormidesmis sp.]